MNHFLQARFRIVEKQQRKEILPGNIPRSNAKELLSGLERRHLYLPSRISSWLWTCEGPCSSCLSKWEFHWLYWICYPWVWWMCVWRTEACSSEFTSHQVTLRGRPPLDLPERSLDLESLKACESLCRKECASLMCCSRVVGNRHCLLFTIQYPGFPLYFPASFSAKQLCESFS